jgi:hypothetical protein
LARGVFKSVQELTADIMDYIQTYNQDLKPSTWTATADTILAKIGRAKAALNELPTA